MNITGNDDFTLISGDSVNITWTPTDLTKGITPLADTKVNIALVRSSIQYNLIDLTFLYVQKLYNTEADVWEDDIILARTIPNSGQAEVIIPDYQELDQTSVRLAHIKVTLSAQTQSSRQKRILPAVLIGGAARWALRYIVKKVIKDAVKRLACEVWHKLDAGVNNARLPPCPCNIEQMRGDDRYTKEGAIMHSVNKYYFKKKNADSCYRLASVG